MFDSVCELFGETIPSVFGCSCYFVVECNGCFRCVCRGALLDRPCMVFQRVCVVPVILSKCSFHMFCLCFCMSEVISSIRSLGTLVGVFVFSVMWSELLMTSAISCPLWSSVYECQRVECAFTSLVRTECGMFVMYCMQCCMSVSAVL